MTLALERALTAAIDALDALGLRYAIVGGPSHTHERAPSMGR